MFFVAKIHRTLPRYCELTELSERRFLSFVAALNVARRMGGTVVRETEDTVTIYRGY